MDCLSTVYALHLLQNFSMALVSPLFKYSILYCLCAGLFINNLWCRVNLENVVFILPAYYYVQCFPLGGEAFFMFSAKPQERRSCGSCYFLQLNTSNSSSFSWHKSCLCCTCVSCMCEHILCVYVCDFLARGRVWHSWALWDVLQCLHWPCADPR